MGTYVFVKYCGKILFQFVRNWENQTPAYFPANQTQIYKNLCFYLQRKRVSLKIGDRILACGALFYFVFYRQYE